MFKRQIKVAKKQKLVFKFIVNGSEWLTCESYKSELDDNGIENNYIDADEFIEVEELEQEDVNTDKGVTRATIGGTGNIREVSNENMYSTDDGANTGGDTDCNRNRDTGDALTATSSFAAISTNNSTTDSRYDNIEDVYEDPQDDYREREVEGGNGNEDENPNGNEFNTPTNSVFNSTVLSTPLIGGLSKYKASSTADTSVSQVDANSHRESYAGKQVLPQNNFSTKDKLTGPKDEMVEILKAPGAFPSPTASEFNTNINYFENNQPPKRETLISKFKNLFKS